MLAAVPSGLLSIKLLVKHTHRQVRAFANSDVTPHQMHYVQFLSERPNDCQHRWGCYLLIVAHYVSHTSINPRW